jgi:hypothetical protein
MTTYTTKIGGTEYTLTEAEAAKVKQLLKEGTGYNEICEHLGHTVAYWTLVTKVAVAEYGSNAAVKEHRQRVRAEKAEAEKAAKAEAKAARAAAKEAAKATKPAPKAAAKKAPARKAPARKATARKQPAAA